MLFSVALAPTAVIAHSHKKKGLEIVHPWTHETADPGTVNIAVYIDSQEHEPHYRPIIECFERSC